MANSLGTLTLDLIAKIGGFTGPLDKASQSSKKNTADIAKSFNDLAKGIGVALGSVPALVTGLVISTANAAKEITQLSKISGLGTTEFQKYAAAAATVGINQEKLADIFKDTNDKVGDFLTTGGGELKNFFDTVAPKVGVTADQFRNLNSADALQLYVSTLQRANVNQSQMTFFMEAIADEATALVPLLKDGAKGFDELGAAAEAAGAIIDGDTIQASADFSKELTILGQFATAAKIALSAEFLPVLVQFSKDVRQSTTDAGGLKTQMEALGETLVDIGAGVASTADVIVRLFTVTANTLVGLALTAMGRTQLLAGQVTSILALLPGETGEDFAKKAEQIASDGRAALIGAAEAAKAIRADFETPLAGDTFREYVKNAKAAAAAARQLTEGQSGTGGNGFVTKTPEQIAADKAAASAAANAAKKINEAFKSTEEGYQRQIALINTTTDATKNATEVAKLQFEIESGKLVGINALQQERLVGLAAELDSLNKIKVANEEAVKLAAFKANLDSSNQNVANGFAQELAGAGSGDKLKERLKTDLAIRQDYAQQVADLQTQFNGGDITKELYDQETAALEEALAERLVMQQDYYNQLDEAQNNWLDGVSSAWENYRDTATNYTAQAAEATQTLLDGTTDSVAANATEAILQTKSVGDAASDIARTFATTVLTMVIKFAAMQAIQAGLNAFTSTAAIPIVGPFAAPAAAASALAFAGGLSTQIAGMAHDGIDSVPADGTWNLQKGERVTTSQTSAKLDKTLDDVQKSNSTGGTGKQTVNIYEDASKAGQTRTRLDDDGVTQLTDVFVSQIYGDGPIGEAIQGRFGLRGQGQ